MHITQCYLGVVIDFRTRIMPHKTKDLICLLSWHQERVLHRQALTSMSWWTKVQTSKHSYYLVLQKGSASLETVDPRPSPSHACSRMGFPSLTGCLPLCSQSTFSSAHSAFPYFFPFHVAEQFRSKRLMKGRGQIETWLISVLVLV